MGQEFKPTRIEEGWKRQRRTVFLSDSSTEAKVDKETGLLVEFFSPQAQALGRELGSPELTIEEANAVAVQFLRNAGISLDGVWTLEAGKFLDHGSGGQEYQFEWTKVFHGIQLPSAITVGVDANTGRVFNYLLFDDPVVVPLRWKLTGKNAVRIVVQKKKWEDAIVEKASLALWYAGGYPGRQALLWRLRLANPAGVGSKRRVMADVDAVTGEIVLMSGLAGAVSLQPKTKRRQDSALPKIDPDAVRKQKLPPTVFELAKRAK